MTDVTFIILPLFIVFWLFCIISAVSNEFQNKKAKIFWIVGLVFVPVLSLFYIFLKKDLLKN